MKKKKVKKFIFVCLKKGMLISLVVSLFVFVPALTKAYKAREDALANKFIGKKAEHQGIITLWNVDTFEGGSASKTSFLESASLKFEKENKGAYINVENLSIDEFLSRVKQGCKSDLLSFGNGIQDYLKKDMQSLPSEVLSNVKSNFLSCGLDAGQLKAVPWVYSAYCLISSISRIEKAGKSFNNNLKELALNLSFDKKLKKSIKHTYSITFGGNEFSNAVNIFSREFDVNLNDEVKMKNIDKNYNKNTFYEAYVNFINGNASVLLGTNRDVLRMENRAFAGKETDVIYEPILSYTDLVQYISVLTTDSKKRNVCLDFIEFILSEKMQTQVKNIGLFSTTIFNLYEDGIFKEIENKINEEMVVKNLF